MTQEFQPSEFQSSIYHFIRDDWRNLLINACAGSGKSSTIVNALGLIPDSKTVIFLAFNRDIIKELKKKVTNSKIEVRTLHSLGSFILGKNGNFEVDKKKVDKIVYDLAETWKLTSEPGIINSDYLNRVSRLVKICKTELCSKADLLETLAEKYDIDVLNGECVRAIEALTVSFHDNKVYDYEDMIFIPATKRNINLPKYDIVFIDECQDLNKAQQKLVLRLFHETSRFIAVGDPQQAIYGFAGADVNSFKNLQNIPNTVTLPLSFSYRCCTEVIELAQTIVPHIQAAPGAKKGKVDRNASESKIQDGDMVLCRNSAPLVKLCLEKIAKGIKAYVKGGDIGANLASMVKKQKTSDLQELFERFEADSKIKFQKIKQKNPKFSDLEVMESNSYQIFIEKITVLRIISESKGVRTTQNLMDRIYEIFSDEKDGICFSTIHKSKGLESERVHIIDAYLMPSKYAKKDWELEQESNLQYVAYTRAKMYLGFISDWSLYKKNTRDDRNRTDDESFDENFKHSTRDDFRYLPTDEQMDADY